MKIRALFFIVLCGWCLLYTNSVLAQTETVVSVPAQPEESGQSLEDDSYQLLADLPGLTVVSSNGDFSSFINTLYTMSIGIAAALAVVMIIYLGIQYAIEDTFTGKSHIKERIPLVVGGLVLLVSASLLLSVINPRLLIFSEVGTNALEVDFDGIEQFELSSVFFDQEAYDPVLHPTVWRNQTGDIFTSQTECAQTNVENRCVEIQNPVYDPGLTINQYVWQNANGELFRDEQECYASTVEGGCSQVDNPYYVDPNLELAPIDSGSLLVMSHQDPAYRAPLDYFVVSEEPTLHGWPVNPYRRPIDFADCKKGGVPTASQQVRIGASVISSDAYVMSQLLQAGVIDSPVPILSAYRSHPDVGGRCKTNGTGVNHPYGFSLDYGVDGLSQEAKVMMQVLVIQSGACRLGFGGGGFHVQWNGKRGAPCTNKVYWCYASNSSKTPYAGAGSAQGFAKAGSCRG